jgi:hypothetical protein
MQPEHRGHIKGSMKGIVSHKFDVPVRVWYHSKAWNFRFEFFFKLPLISRRIFEYSMFRDEFLLSPDTVNELGDVARFVNSVGTLQK